MDCKVCGSSEFVTNDGITYCTECQSQIEETQTEVAVEHTLSRDIGSSGPKKKIRVQKKQEYDDWITVECFNHILYMQVSSLIKLGASIKLKSTVLHIWSKYLQRCEIAFRTDYLAKNGKPLLGSIPCKRDLKVLYGNREMAKYKRRKTKKSDAKLPENPSVVLPENPSVELPENPSVELPQNLSAELLENPSADERPSAEDNNVQSDTNTSVCSESKRSKLKYSSHARKMLRKRQPTAKVIYKVFNMTLSKTLSICYLGLLYTEDQLLLSDFIRFVYEEKIPYVNLLDKLPSTFKLQRDDRTFHTYIVPDTYTILRTAREIMHFIKLPEYKKPSISLAAVRLARDLNLPNDMLLIIKTLINRYKEELPNWAFANKNEDLPVEYQALASILVAMKMLFILDDKFEFEHSQVMNKLNALNPGGKYFEWKEWKEHSMVKEFLFLCEKPGYCSMSNLDSMSANLIISKHPYTALKSTSSEDTINPRAVFPTKNKISKVLSDLVHIPSKSPNISTSFPLRRAVKSFMEEWRTLPMYKETKEMDFTLLKKDFSSCSLYFNPLQFDPVDDELSYLLMTSLYIPHSNMSMEFLKNYWHEVICTTSDYWILHFLPKDYAVSDVNANWLHKLPHSFKWLFNFFCRYACCNNTALYKEVVRMEKILFLKKRSVIKHVKDKAKYQNKINLDF